MRSCHGLRDRCRIRWHFLSAGDLQRVASEVVSASFLSLRATTTTTTTTKLQHTWLLNLFCGSSTCVRMSYKGWNDLRWTRLVFYFLFFFFISYLLLLFLYLFYKSTNTFKTLWGFFFWQYSGYFWVYQHMFYIFDEAGVFCAALIVVILLNFSFFYFVVIVVQVLRHL